MDNVNSSDCQSPWLVAVHGGAGYHSTDLTSEKAVKHALRSACTAALDVLQGNRGKTLDAVERAICTLEDDQCLNAGYGSNLTIDGTVECDASIMDGASHDFGSAGATQGVKNPISLARAILANSRKPHPLGRLLPLTLVGPGAQAFAASAGLQLVEPQSQISERAKREWHKWKAELEDAKSTDLSSAAFAPSTIGGGTGPGDQSLLGDTVGSVACDPTGGLSAGVSSGGLLLKYPGRIGEAVIFGAGVWAHSPPGKQSGVACSVSGTGEAIIRTSFARSLAEALYDAPPEETHEVIRSKFEAFIDEIGARKEEPDVGILAVTKEALEDGDYESEPGSDLEGTNEEEPEEIETPKPEKHEGAQGSQLETTSKQSLEPQKSPSDTIPRVRVRLWCAFTTESMALAYASSEDKKPRAMILRHQTYRGHRNSGVKRSVHIVALPLSR